MWITERRVLQENEYCRLIEDNANYVIEVKPILGLPTEFKGVTSTGIMMIVEWVVIGSGLYMKRIFLPRSEVTREVALRTFDTVTSVWKKKAETVARWKRIFEGGGIE